MHAEELAKTIDHTMLRADGTSHDVERLCREATRYHFAAVCLFPHFAGLAADLLRGADVKVCTVISFPFGADTARTKVFGAEDAKGGAVVNGPRFFEQPTCHSRPTVTSGVLAEESSAMLKAFFKARRS